jgi:hypothetical protein
MLNSKIALGVLLYDPQLYTKLVQLSPNWRLLVLEGLDELFKPIES